MDVKIKQALDILVRIGMPRAQQNERSALCLLALLDLGPQDEWSNASNPLIGITPMMEFARNKYDRAYAPNTRETFRRQTIHQFEEAGIVQYNPDDPERAVNSPKAVYQVSSDFLALVVLYGNDDWVNMTTEYLKSHVSLTKKYQWEREQIKIPVRVNDSIELKLSAGSHSNLIKNIIEDFAPRFIPGSKLIYAGDTGDKTGYFDRDALLEIGVQVDEHGKMPDVIFLYGEKNWLILVESVTSHGPVDGKRHYELSKLFSDSTAGIVYVTAFPTRTLMAGFLSGIAWETEVWVSESPSHLIHFNGDRFLGPHN